MDEETNEESTRREAWGGGREGGRVAANSAYTGWWLWWTRLRRACDTTCSTSISRAVGKLLDDGGITEASSKLRGAASYS